MAPQGHIAAYASGGRRVCVARCGRGEYSAHIARASGIVPRSACVLFCFLPTWLLPPHVVAANPLNVGPSLMLPPRPPNNGTSQLHPLQGNCGGLGGAWMSFNLISYW